MALREFEVAKAPESPFLSKESAYDLFDRAAQDEVGMSGEEFLVSFDAGQFRDLPDTPDGRRTMRVMHLIPFARQNPR